MMQAEQIKKTIAAGLVCEGLDVDGDGEHFEAIIVSAEFVGKSRIQRQQMVNALLREDFDRPSASRTIGQPTISMP